MTRGGNVQQVDLAGAPESGLTTRRVAATDRAAWSWGHICAIIGAPFLVWAAWTVIAWLADGPYQHTNYRDTSSVAWYAAHTVEAILVAMGVVVLVLVVRECRRERRLTFHAMVCIAGPGLLYLDYGSSFFHPTLINSTNWVNVNSMCGQMPLVVNPDCGQVPDPILFNFLFFTFGNCAMMMLVTKLMRRIRERRPQISNVQLLLVVAGSAAVNGIMFHGVMLSLELWNYPNAPWGSIPFRNGFRLPLAEIVAIALSVTAFAALDFFRDDRGLTIVERGLERHRPRVGRAIAALGTFGVLNLVVWGANVAVMTTGFYARQWDEQPAHVVNDVFDAPGTPGGTTYGPCPGTPGYRMPGRDTFDESAEESAASES